MNLSRMHATAKYIRDWKEHCGRTDWGLPHYYRHMKAIAEEQRANYESCTSGGRTPGWCDPDEYRQCVELLEAEVAATVRRLLGLALGRLEALQDEWGLEAMAAERCGSPVRLQHALDRFAAYETAIERVRNAPAWR